MPAGRQRRERLDSGSAVIRMDEFHERSRAEFGLRKAEHGLPGGIDPDEIAVERRHAEEVERQLEKSVELFTRQLALDVQPDLTADRRDRGEKGRRWFDDVAAEEFHHPHHARALQDGKAESGVKTGPLGDGRAREIRIAGHVWYPGGLAGGPDATGQADPGVNVNSSVAAANSLNGSDGDRHIPTHCRTFRARSTSHKAPYRQPSPSQTASSMRGAASTRVGDSVSARAVSNRICWYGLSGPMASLPSGPGGGDGSFMRSPHLSTDVSITLRLPPSCVWCHSTAAQRPGFPRGLAMAANTAARRRILIVDDDRALRFVLSDLLIDAGHTVIRPPTGAKRFGGSTQACSTSCCSTSVCRT